VRAACANGDELIADAREQDRFIFGVTKELVSRTNSPRIDSTTQIGTAQLVVSAHVTLRHAARLPQHCIRFGMRTAQA